MTSPILFVGGEYGDFSVVGGGVGAAGFAAIDTTAGRFRAGYARYGIALNNSSLANPGIPNLLFLVSPSLTGGAGGVANFWTSTRVFCFSAATNGTSGPAQNLMEWRDQNNVLRMRLANTSTTTGATEITQPLSLFKVSAASVSTQLGTASVGTLTSSPAVPDKIDVFVNYGTSGQVLVYINGALAINSGTVDTTTDGNTALDQVWLGQIATGGSSSAMTTVWSEVIVATRDTRNMSLVTQVPTANGNTHNFTSNLPANMAVNLSSDAAPDYSVTAGQIDEYTVTPAMPAGNFGVISYVQHARAAVGASGPTKMALMVRNGGTDYQGGTLTPSLGWGLMTTNWDLNPNTGAAWQTSDLVNASTAFNTGVISIT